MPVRLTAAALSDLAAIRTHIGAENTAAASRVAVQLLGACDRLECLPERGRPGLVPGTREIAAVWPYVIVYQLQSDRDVTVLRIWHGAQRRD